MLAHLAAADADSRVYYVENGLFNSLFGLLCWEAIFAPLPGAFFHAYHHGPADLYAADFRRRRQELFDRCLRALEQNRHAEPIRARYAAKSGIQSPFVDWSLMQPELLELALTCIPAPDLRACCEWILRDIGANGAGFPDLVQFWPAQRRYRLIEVKGPGDRLQENQRRLFEYFAQQAIPACVMHVRWQPAVDS